MSNFNSVLNNENDEEIVSNSANDNQAINDSDEGNNDNTSSNPSSENENNNPSTENITNENNNQSPNDSDEGNDDNTSSNPPSEIESDSSSSENNSENSSLNATSDDQNNSQDEQTSQTEQNGNPEVVENVEVIDLKNRENNNQNSNENGDIEIVSTQEQKENQENNEKNQENSEKEDKKEDTSKDDDALLKEKNDKFKKKLTNFNNIMGETLSYVGIWLTVCSLIPGIGLFALIPGLIIGGIGLIQSTFADKLVFKPYKNIKNKIKACEDEQLQEFETRDRFIENENQLSLENEKSQGLCAKLNENYLESSDNQFAKEFAQLFNSNGVGLVSSGQLNQNNPEEPKNSENITNTTQLNQMENLDSRIAMTMKLDEISKTQDDKTRQALIEDFSDTFFEDLSESQKSAVNSMFRADNKNGLISFVKDLNNANAQQSRERSLLEKQRQTIRSADSYRLLSLVSSHSMDEQQREKFFERYSPDIIQSVILNNNSSSELLDQIIDKVPAESQDMATEKLDDAARSMNLNLQIIEQQAYENESLHQRVEVLEQYKSSIDDVSSNKDNFSTL